MENQVQTFQRIAPIQSVERAIWILKCFEDHESLSLSEISRMVSLHKSTVFGLVSTLEAYQLLEQDEKAGRYRLGISLFRLGSRVNNDLRSIVAPHLDKLVSMTGETVNFVIPDHDCVVYLDKKESHRSMRIATSLGQREPMYRTAAGKAILALMPENAARSILENSRYESLTRNTLMSTDEVMRELMGVRRWGYAVDREELEYGLICIGVALVNSRGVPVGGISISGPSSRMTPANQELFAGYLLDCSRQISRRI